MKKLLLFTLFWAIIAQAKTIMWDLGDTLYAVNKIAYAGELGAFDAAMYMIFDAGFDTDMLQDRIFETLYLLTGIQEGEYQSMHNGIMPLPLGMHLWLAGHYPDPEKLIVELEQGVDTLHDEGYYLNNREYRIIRKAVRAMFEPQTLIRHQTVIKSMHKLLERIDLDNHTCMILSNWDNVSFDTFLESTGKKLLDYIDRKNMVISGAIGINKPHPAFFEYVLHTYNLDPHDCIFIDNDSANITTARACGIQAIHFTGNVKEVELELKNLGVFA